MRDDGVDELQLLNQVIYREETFKGLVRFFFPGEERNFWLNHLLILFLS